jgi:hypothetical protein
MATKPGACAPGYTKIVKSMTEKELTPSMGISLAPYTRVDGFRHWDAVSASQ